MNKKIIKIFAISMLIIVLLFINQAYANSMDLNTEAVEQVPFNNSIINVVLSLSELVQMSLLIISFVLTITEKIKSKNIKSLSLRIWIILATIFWFLNLAINAVRLGSRGGMLIEHTPEEIMQKNKIFMKNVILLSLAGYAILTIMILIPVKKIKKYKKSDKISKGEEENVRND